MSFNLCALYGDRGVIAGDRMLSWEDGSCVVGDSGKIFELSDGLVVGYAGNELVSQMMMSCFAGIIGDEEKKSLELFERKIKDFKKRFDPIYRIIPKEWLNMCRGSGHLMGVGVFENELKAFSVNYVPVYEDYSVDVLKKPGVIASNADGNERLQKFFPTALKWILSLGPAFSDEGIVLLFKKIFGSIAKYDETVSPCGDLMILRRDGTSKKLTF